MLSLFREFSKLASGPTGASYHYTDHLRSRTGTFRMIIKVLLVTSILAFGYLAVRGRPSARHLALRRVLAVLVLAFGVVGVMAPSLVTDLANAVGVGRGADLVLYVLTVAFLLVTATLMQRMTDMERRYVELARRFAIDEALQAHAKARRPSGSVIAFDVSSNMSPLAVEEDAVGESQ